MAINTQAADTQTRQSGENRLALKQRATEEGKRFLLMFVYLWVFFGVFSLHSRIILRQEGIGVGSQTLAVVNALVLGKVMLVAEDLRPARRLPSRPLIYPILGESAVMTVIFIAFHMLEQIVVGLIGGKDLRDSVTPIGGGGILGVVLVAVILFVVLLPYLGFSNVNRALEPGRLHTLLFGVPRKADAAPP